MIERKIWEVLNECWGNYTNEFIIWMYLWTFWLSSEMIRWHFVFIFAHVIPKGRVLNRITALCTENSCNSAFPYKASAAVRERIYRDLVIFTFSLCAVFVWPKTDRFCMPCCRFWPVEEKQVYVDSTHLNNSDKLSRIIYGADKIQLIIY